jgi:ADP-ribose pyrophosphatase YjhB (NUDIX family)
MGRKWLEWAQRIQSVSQAGLEYSKDPFDIERFEQLRLISSEIVAEYSGLDLETVVGLFANETGYQTPKIDVRAAIIENGKILLVQEQDTEWALPGGWAEPRLTLRENIVKEVQEEAGIEVVPESIIAVLNRSTHIDDEYPYSVYKIFVQCRSLGGKFEKNIETLNAAFFDRQSLPEISETRNTTKQIEMCFERSQMEGEDVIFD